MITSRCGQQIYRNGSICSSGLGMIGAVLVTVNTNYKSNELEYILNQSDSTTLVLMGECRGHQLLQNHPRGYPSLDTAKPGKLDAPKLARSQECDLYR